MHRGQGVVRNSRGATLVELMITVGLIGVSSLALMSLLGQYTSRTAQQQFEAELAEDLLGFSELLEAHLANATLVDYCGCGPLPPAGNTCVYDATTPDCTLNPGGCNNAAIIRFEYEDSTDPSILAPANCNFGGAPFAAAVSPQSLIPRGCKHRARLVYTPPTNAASALPRPGTLALVREDPATGNPITAGGVQQALFTVSGVTSFKCGHPDNPSRPGTPATGSFRFTIGAKARASRVAPGDPNFDSWHPSDTARGFARGTHRSLTTDVSFRNLTTPGVQFGKATTEKNCTIDGLVDTNANCCSGFWNPTTQLCTSMATCLVQGTAALGFTQCCSHMLDATSGVCL